MKQKREYTRRCNGAVLNVTVFKDEQQRLAFLGQEPFEHAAHPLCEADLTERDKFMAESLFLGEQPEQMPVLDLDAMPVSSDDLAFLITCAPEFNEAFAKLSKCLSGLRLGTPAELRSAIALTQIADEGVALARQCGDWQRRVRTLVLAQTTPAVESDEPGIRPAPPELPDKKPARRWRRMLTELATAFASFVFSGVSQP